MKHFTTYLTFGGTCRDAMTFYSGCLGGELHLMPLSGAPGNHPPGSENLIMHSRIVKNGVPLLMASDAIQGGPLQIGTNFSVAVECESAPEIDTLFAGLSEGGTVSMPLADTFWGARFGMLTDRFGIQWMLNYEFPKA